MRTTSAQESYLRRLKNEAFSKGAHETAWTLNQEPETTVAGASLAIEQYKTAIECAKRKTPCLCVEIGTMLREIQRNDTISGRGIFRTTREVYRAAIAKGLFSW